MDYAAPAPNALAARRIAAGIAALAVAAALAVGGLALADDNSSGATGAGAAAQPDSSDVNPRPGRLGPAN